MFVYQFFFCVFFLFSFFFYSLWWNGCVCMLCDCCIYVINRQSVNNTYCTTKCCSFPFFVMIGGRENEKDSMQIFKRWLKHSTYQHFYLLYMHTYIYSMLCYCIWCWEKRMRQTIHIQIIISYLFHRHRQHHSKWILYLWVISENMYYTL